MEIEVRLHAFLRNYLPKESQGFTGRMTFGRRVTVREVFAALQIPDEAVKQIMIILINGVRATPDQLVSDGDVLTLVPVAAGG